MASTNKVFLSGMLGRDPKAGVTQGGLAWANASLAISKKRKDAYETHWVKLVAFGKTAEMFNFFHKGDLVVIEGELTTNVFEKDGVKHHSTEVLVWSAIKGVKQNELPQQPEEGAAQDGFPQVAF